MVTTQMKTDAQRLGNGKKAFNVKQVEKMMEDAGGSYTAGTGIAIANNSISVDTAIIQEKLTAGDGITIADNVISAGGGEYTLYASTTWSNIFKKEEDGSTWHVTKDCVIVIRDNENYVYTTNLFKGVKYGNAITLYAASYAQSGNTVNTATIWFAFYNVNFDSTAISLTRQLLKVSSSATTGSQSSVSLTKDTTISGYIGNDHIRLFVKE